MSLSTLGWIGLPVVCYFIVRPIKNVWLRGAITTAASSVVVFNATKDLPIGQLSTMMGTVLPWMTSIRLVHLMTLPEDQIREMNFLEFVKKFLWFFCPISKNTKEPRPLLKIFIQDTLPNLIITALKVFASHWMRDWLLACLQEVSSISSSSLSAGEIVSQNYFKYVIYTLMYGFLVLTTDYIPSNLQPGLCSLLTGDRYRCLPFSDWVILSNSPRVFWGRRYNKLVGSLLNESVFQPLRRFGLSTQLSALSAFTVSGLLHVHVSQVAFGQGAGTSIVFFLLHGLISVLDVRLGWSFWPKPIGWALNTTFLAATLPLYLGLFIKACPDWLLNNPPQIPLPSHLHLPVPSLRV